MNSDNLNTVLSLTKEGRFDEAIPLCRHLVFAPGAVGQLDQHNMRPHSRLERVAGKFRTPT